MPGATRNSLTCWAIPRWWFRLVDRLRACPSACRSSVVHGWKNSRCLLLPSSKENAERGGSPLLREWVQLSVVFLHYSIRQPRVSTLSRTRFHALWADSAVGC